MDIIPYYYLLQKPMTVPTKNFMFVNITLNINC